MDTRFDIWLDDMLVTHMHTSGSQRDGRGAKKGWFHFFTKVINTRLSVWLGAAAGMTRQVPATTTIKCRNACCTWTSETRSEQHERIRIRPTHNGAVRNLFDQLRNHSSSHTDCGQHNVPSWWYLTLAVTSHDHLFAGRPSCFAPTYATNEKY